MTSLAELSAKARDTSSLALDLSELQFWLEWSGTTLLSLREKSPLPQSPGSAWPAYNYEFAEAYGYTGERLRAPIPSSTDIQLMDYILPFVGLVEDRMLRRILSARSLVTPISDRYLFPWAKLGKLLGRDYRWVSRQHIRGLTELNLALDQRKIDTVRHLFNLYNIRP